MGAPLDACKQCVPVYEGRERGRHGIECVDANPRNGRIKARSYWFGPIVLVDVNGATHVRAGDGRRGAED